MFGSIASRYDLTNSVLSFGTHFLWRRVLVREIPRSGVSKAIDICTGTGDLIPPIAARAGFVVGADFCRPMLVAGLRKLKKELSSGKAALVQADALNLPFEDGTFDVATVSFGVRNFEDLEVGLREISRILRQDGKLLVLEFGQPKGLWGAMYRLYSRFVMPLIGGVLTGNFYAYKYLPQTAQNFPCGSEFKEILKRCGFQTASSRPLTGGIAFLYSAKREG